MSFHDGFLVYSLALFHSINFHQRITETVKAEQEGKECQYGGKLMRHQVKIKS